jgi:xanthine/CO dehydrogenase XdhC/CoxF family maturation factor
MNIYEEIVKLQREGRRGAVATIVNSRGSIPSFQSAKMLIRDDGSIAGTIGGGCVEAEVWQAAREVIAEEKPRSLSFDLNQDPKYDTGLVCGGTLEIFIEPILPSSLLYIFGAGHVALELFKAARNAGFECVVADDREAYANPERFPDAVRVVAREFDETFKELTPRTSLPPSRLISSSPPAAIATTCAFSAGQSKPRRATSACSAPNGKPLPSSANSRAKGSVPSFSTACIRPSASTSAPSLPKKLPSPSSPS